MPRTVMSTRPVSCAVENGFGWIKTIAGQERTKFRGSAPRRLGFYLRSRRLQPDAAPKILAVT